MKRILAGLFVSVFYQAAFGQMNELAKDMAIVQPTQSQYAMQSQLVNRHILATNTDLAIHNVIRDVVRDVGSDKSKNVNIIWSDSSAKLSAEHIQKALIAKGIKKNNIHIKSVSKGQLLYPLYVEVEHKGIKKTNCRFDTAEDHMSFDPYKPCATKNNYRIQLKN
ncbi:protein RcpB [Lonepinella koalarum]|uniref:protein RcpB n=1 Tax=Lonepinella koalarum TaxID=53417 RepID=UPI003F6DC529